MLLRLLAVTVAEPLCVILFPVSVTVQESPEQRLPAVHVVACAEPSYVHEVVPHERVTYLALMVSVLVFDDGRA